jgi:hypothetical protein
MRCDQTYNGSIKDRRGRKSLRNNLEIAYNKGEAITHKVSKTIRANMSELG